MVVCGGVWWFAVVCGGLRWFVVDCGGLSFSHTVYGSLVRAGIHGYFICTIYGFCVGGKSFHYSNPSLAQTYIHFYELILLVRLPYVIGELFSKYQPGTKRTCLIIVILRQLHAATLCSTLFRRRQSVILFRRL